jgi:biotin carboxyl carrier protein
MEAMKMEYAIKAPFDGVVESFLAGVDELVEGGQLLINFVADEVVV